MKPNNGVISGSKVVKVLITLNPIPPSVKDHKFMIQAAKTDLTEADATVDSLNDFWKSIKDLGSDAKEDHKMKVVLHSADFAGSSSSEVIKVKSSTETFKSQPLGASVQGEQGRVTEINESVYIAAADDKSKSEINEWKAKIEKMEK